MFLTKLLRKRYTSYTMKHLSKMIIFLGKKPPFWSFPSHLWNCSQQLNRNPVTTIKSLSTDWQRYYFLRFLFTFHRFTQILPKPPTNCLHKIKIHLLFEVDNIRQFFFFIYWGHCCFLLVSQTPPVLVLDISKKEKENLWFFSVLSQIFLLQ